MSCNPVDELVGSILQDLERKNSEQEDFTVRHGSD